MMQIKNIQNTEQLFSLAEKIHEFLKMEVHTDDIEVAVSRGHQLTAFMANTGKMLADARYWKDKAVKDSILYQIRDSKAMSLPASVLNELIKADTKDFNYLVNMIERLDRETVHQLDWLRTIISKAKEEMKMVGSHQG